METEQFCTIPILRDMLMQKIHQNRKQVARDQEEQRVESWCLMTVGFLSDLIQSLEISFADFRTRTILYFGHLVFEIGFSM